MVALTICRKEVAGVVSGERVSHRGVGYVGEVGLVVVDVNVELIANITPNVVDVPRTVD